MYVRNVAYLLSAKYTHQPNRAEITPPIHRYGYIGVFFYMKFVSPQGYKSANVVTVGQVVIDSSRVVARLRGTSPTAFRPYPGDVYNLNPILNPLRLVRTPIHGSLLSQNLEENNFHILQYLRVSSIVIIQLFFYKPLLGKISLYVVINSSETPLFASIICSLLMSKEEYDLVLDHV